MNEIDVIIDKIDDIKNKYNDKKFSKEFYDYVEMECNKLSDKKSVILRFNVINGINEKEQEEVEKVYYDHYKRLVNELSNSILYENFKEVALIVFGLIFLCLYYFFESHNVIIISDVFLIVGWLSLWESAYSIVFALNGEKNKLKQYKKLKNAKIEFVR